ncbi:hypothetical protein RJJ65_39015, partial [Rhizobium hidalgonense]
HCEDTNGVTIAWASIVILTLNASIWLCKTYPYDLIHTKIKAMLVFCMAFINKYHLYQLTA